MARYSKGLDARLGLRVARAGAPAADLEAGRDKLADDPVAQAVPRCNCHISCPLGGPSAPGIARAVSAQTNRGWVGAAMAYMRPSIWTTTVTSRRVPSSPDLRNQRAAMSVPSKRLAQPVSLLVAEVINALYDVRQLMHVMSRVDAPAAWVDCGCQRVERQALVTRVVDVEALGLCVNHHLTHSGQPIHRFLHGHPQVVLEQSAGRVEGARWQRWREQKVVATVACRGPCHHHRQEEVRARLIVLTDHPQHDFERFIGGAKQLRQVLRRGDLPGEGVQSAHAVSPSAAARFCKVILTSHPASGNHAPRRL